jgi:hypothetical protein
MSTDTEYPGPSLALTGMERRYSAKKFLLESASPRCSLSVSARVLQSIRNKLFCRKIVKYYVCFFQNFSTESDFTAIRFFTLQIFFALFNLLVVKAICEL